jgi:putative transposase
MKYEPINHNRKSIRLKGYDYSQEGMYYVTIRTKGGECLLGDVVQNEVKLSAIGEIAQSFWLEIPQHFNNVRLDVFQVMPNHLHGIIVIKESLVRTRHAVSIRDEAVKIGRAKNEFSKPVTGSLPTIVGSFKSAVT